MATAREPFIIEQNNKLWFNDLNYPSILDRLKGNDNVDDLNHFQILTIQYINNFFEIRMDSNLKSNQWFNSNQLDFV